MQEEDLAETIIGGLMKLFQHLLWLLNHSDLLNIHKLIGATCTTFYEVISKNKKFDRALELCSSTRTLMSPKPKIRKCVKIV